MDRFCTLPDELITHTVSFMSVIGAVQTCILSRQWKNAWTFLPVLKFDIADWVEISGWLDDEEQVEEGEEIFNGFLYHLLAHRDAESRLDKLEFKNHFENLDSDEISLGFLNKFVPHQPRIICIDVARRSLKRLYVPEEILACPSIEQFELTVNITDGQPVFYRIKSEAWNLRTLKTLTLMGIDLDDRLVQNVCSEQRVIQTIVLTLCYLDITEISSKVLKKLTIDKCSHSKTVKISCPGLCDLIIESYDESARFALCNLQSLEFAKIYMDLDKIHGDPNLLRSLANVKHLNFGLWGNEFKTKLEKEISQCGTFMNLKELDVSYRGLIDDIDFIVDILNHSPSLEILSLQPYQLQKCQSKEEISQKGLEKSRDVLFKREYLKTVRIVKPKRQPDMEVQRLTNKLRNHIKTIGLVHIIG